ncbi:MAG: hypothetical protein II730_10785, partial [Bacteroidales bacterium]|nr:hypothetical protein [Bacteroidales bacterium]
MRRLFLIFCLLLPLACTRAETRVVLGDERFEDYFPLLEGKRIAILSNQTGIVGDMISGKPSRVSVTDESASVPFSNIG